MGIGISGLGVFLPEERRSNNWWSESTVKKWTSRREDFLRSLQPVTPGEEAVAKAFREDDIFGGSKERRIASPNVTSADMEVRAVEDLIERWNVDIQSVDALISHTPTPERLLTNPACTVHARLKLKKSCLTMSLESASSSFLHQLQIAEALIEAKKANSILVTQSSLCTRLLTNDEPYSPWFGDGATAVLVSSTNRLANIKGFSNTTRGELQDTLHATVEEGRWFDDGKARLHTGKKEAMNKMFLGTADRAKEVIVSALHKCGLETSDIDFYGCHQGTSWLRAVTQKFAGIAPAKSVDTFPWAASLSSANLPLVLATASKEGLLLEKDTVLLYTGGTGITDCAAVLHWGA